MSDDDDDFDDDMVMSEDKTEARAVGLKAFRAAAEKFFAAHPEYRSVMLGVAQYWADEADDAVHYDLVASARTLPLWPHRCDAMEADDYVNVPGELCWNCGEIGYLDAWDDNGGAITAFQAFCHEAGSQEESSANNYLPYAVARRVGKGVEVEVIGRVERPWDDFDDADGVERDDTWDDPRARELLELVVAAPAEDGPRRVLADYLLERENPRGEYIALSLDGAEPERCAALLAEHGARWLHPLQRVLTASSVRWSRGFVVAADAYAHAGELEQIRGATAWGTIERLHIHRNTDCLLDPAMRALRELGPIDDNWLDALVGAPRPWAIESLEVELDTADIAKLGAATTLPKLRALTISARDLDAAVAQLPSAVWWKQLERLTVVDDDVTKWYGRRRELGVPWLAIVREHTDPTNAKGWEIAYGPNDACEITQRGWTPHASIDELADLLTRIPAPAGYKLVPSAYYEPSDVDMERLALARPMTN